MVKCLKTGQERIMFGFFTANSSIQISNYALGTFVFFNPGVIFRGYHKQWGDRWRINIGFNMKIFQANGNKGRVNVNWQDEHKHSPSRDLLIRNGIHSLFIYLGAVYNLVCDIIYIQKWYLNMFSYFLRPSLGKSSIYVCANMIT